jgi:hypothetical protein
MTRRPGGYGLWIIALVCWLPLSAAAEEPGSVRWHAPGDCPTQQQVEHLLSRVDSAARLSVDAAVERDQAGYRLRLRVRGTGRSFERELAAESCELLAESAVFLVELAGSQLSAAGVAPKQVEATEPAARTDAAPEHAESAVREPELVSSAVPETTRRAPDESQAAADGGERGPSLRLGFGAAMIEAGLSGVTPHLAIDLSLGISDWSVGLRLGALLHPALRVAEGAEVDLQTNAAQLLGCRYWDVASVLIGPCLALSALHTSAHSTGLTGQQTSSATWLSAGPALSLQLRVVWALLLGIEIGAWAALSPRPSFEVEGNTVARAGTLAGYARLGAAYELW